MFHALFCATPFHHAINYRPWSTFSRSSYRVPPPGLQILTNSPSIHSPIASGSSGCQAIVTTPAAGVQIRSAPVLGAVHRPTRKPANSRARMPTAKVTLSPVSHKQNLDAAPNPQLSTVQPSTRVHRFRTSVLPLNLDARDAIFPTEIIPG